MNPIVFIIRLVLILGIPLAIGYGTYQFVYANFFEPMDPKATTPIVVEVTPGSSFKDLCVSLEKQNLLKHWWVLSVISRLRGESTRIQPGEYLLSQTMTPLQLLKTIASGKLYKRTLVLSAGSDALDTIAAFQNAGLGEEEELIEKMKSTELLVRAGIRGESVLGYLAPGQYEFSKSETLDRMFWDLLDKASNIWSTDLLTQADRLRMSRHEVITLASLIQATGASISTMPQVASVYHNRLDSVMLLKSEAALRHILKKKSDSLTEEDKKFQSPYNTFVNYGLPPGPINNPSIEAIYAALYPPRTKFFDFIAKEGGNFEFIEQVEVEPLSIPSPESPSPSPNPN